MNFPDLKKYAAAVLASFPALPASPLSPEDSPLWHKAFNDFQRFHSELVRGEVSKKTARGIFARDGNSKLPFLSFSTLPAADCPGAGACLSFCYSFKSWRNVRPFFRQLRNSLLIRHARESITAELDRILSLPRMRSREKVEFRLYVDGDFYSADCVAFWQDVLRSRPRLSAYGYSKSWQELLSFHDSGGVWASNYKLNLSSGSKWENYGPLRARMAALPVTRGEFVAVALAGSRPRSVDYSSAEYREGVKSAAKTAGIPRFFVCPGKCGECTPKGHFCGSNHKTPVLIGIH
jgi:hypothetical protein